MIAKDIADNHLSVIKQAAETYNVMLEQRNDYKDKGKDTSQLDDKLQSIHRLLITANDLIGLWMKAEYENEALRSTEKQLKEIKDYYLAGATDEEMIKFIEQ